MARLTVCSRAEMTLVVSAGSAALVLALTACATAMIPAIGADLRASQSDLQWIADIFPLVLAMLLLPAGSLLDRFGRRRGMIGGLVILAGALAITGTGGSVAVVLASRAGAGVGAALVFPATLALIRLSLPAAQQARAIVIWALALILGSVLGLLVGAAATAISSWRLAFVVFAALSVLLAVLSAATLPADDPTTSVRFDLSGILLSVGGLGSVVFALTEGPVRGWLDPVVLACGISGVIALVGFVGWELHCERPLLDVRVFADSTTTVAVLTLLLLFLADYGMFFLVFQYEAYVLHYNTLHSTLALLPPALGIILTAPLSPILSRRLGLRRTACASLSLCAVGTFTCALTATVGTYWSMMPGLFLLWAGIGLGMLGPTEAILGSLSSARLGVASALNDLTRELGAAIGIAITGTAFASAYRSRVVSAADDHRVSALLRSPAVMGLDPAHVDRGHALPIAVLRDGVIDGWQAAFFVLAALLVTGALFTLSTVSLTPEPEGKSGTPPLN